MLRLTLTLLCCSLAFAAQAADVYKWKDAQGHVHYGDQPKNGSEKVNVSPVNSEAEVKASADAAAQRAQKAQDCGRKRDQLSSYQSALRIVEKDALGNEREYSEAERQKLIALKQKQIAEQCADVPAEDAKSKSEAQGAQ